MAGAAAEQRSRVSFTVQTIDCIACTPVFRRGLGKLVGVFEVKELPITNKVLVFYDAQQLDRAALEVEVKRIANQAGFGGKVIFGR